MAIAHIVTRINANTVQLNWTSSAAENASWVFSDGELVAGPLKPGTTDRSVQVQASNQNTYSWEVQDSDGQPLSITVEGNYFPEVSWRVVPSAVSYTLQINGLLVKVIRADNSEARQSTKVPQRLPEGWNLLEVIATGANGDTEISEDRWFRVYAPGAPVPQILITDGSGAGLYDITLP